VRHESTGLSLGARDKLRAAVLSAVAGFVDAAGVLSLAALFPAHITGELVSEAVALASGHRGAAPSRLWMLPAFVLAVALAAVVARIERRAGRQPVPVLLALVAAGLFAFTLSGAVVRFWPGASPLAVTRFGACFAVAAMGFQNALMRESLNGSAPTTFMTGNLTQLIIEIVDHLFSAGRRPGIASDVERSISRARLKMAAIALSSFLVAAALGAWLTHAVGPVSALVPTLLVSALSLQAFRERGTKPLSIEQKSPIGMRRPTPIQRPLGKHPRPESGTRFKAVRLEEDEALEPVLPPKKADGGER
jgi:uncharacterized membrane protein YoaK (UPF0700 family)